MGQGAVEAMILFCPQYVKHLGVEIDKMIKIFHKDKKLLQFEKTGNFIFLSFGNN